MANFHIAFDDNDALLGLYFKRSKNDLVAFINLNCINPIINEISSGRCNQAFIDLFIPTINHSNFLFIAYSHGDTDRLKANRSYYVHSPLNTHLFNNSLFYSMACHTGKEMGISLSQVCHSFIGYNDIAYTLTETFEQVSINCDNFGIKQFILGSNLEESFQMMKNYFTEQMDILEGSDEALRASFLGKTRDALVLYGNSELLFNIF